MIFRTENKTKKPTENKKTIVRVSGMVTYTFNPVLPTPERLKLENYELQG